MGATTDTYGYVGQSETTFALAGGASTRLSAFDLGGSRISVKDGSTLGYLVPDLHGSVVATETSGSSAIASALRYDGYGRTAAVALPGGTVALDTRYTGALDLSPDSTPLYDIGARLYSPASGAWTSLDTYGGHAQDPASMNRFLYAHANPTTFIDPTGHFAQDASDEKVPSQTWIDHTHKQYKEKAGGGGGTNTGGGADPPADDIEAWAPVTFEAWVSWSQDERLEYSLENAGELDNWGGWGNNEASIIAYLMAKVVNREAMLADVGTPFILGRLIDVVDRDFLLARIHSTNDFDTVTGLLAAWNGLDSPEEMHVIGIASQIGVISRTPFGRSTSISQAGAPALPAVDVAANRVKLRVGTKAQIREAAVKTANGDYIDPNTGAVVPKDGPFHYGHKPGFEWWRTQKLARLEKWTREQVIEFENDWTHYQIESPASNMSRRFELPR